MSCRSAFLLILIISILSVGSAYCAEIRPAMLAVDSRLSGDRNVEMAVAAAVELVASVFKIEPVVSDDSIRPEFKPVSGCSPDSLAGEKVAISTGIADGRRAFFEEMDIERATAVLGPTLDRYLSRPCLTAADQSLKTASCRAGILYVRLLLLLGRPELASAHTAAIAGRCSNSDLMAEDVPPDVTAFVHKVIVERETRVLAARNNLDMVGTGDCLQVFIDGYQLDATIRDAGAAGAAPVVMAGGKVEFKSVPVLPGRHIVEVMVPDFGWMTASFDYEGGHRALLLDPLLKVRSVAKFGLVVDHPVDEIAADLAAASGMAVLGIVPVPGGSNNWQVIVLRDPIGKMTDRVLAVLAAQGSSLKFSTVKGSPLVFGPKRSWPWPWVTGSLAAAFLGTGVALNVYANRAWDDAEQGSITRDRGDAFNAGAIAGYSLAGAGVLATVLLAVLRPSEEPSVLVEPTASGFRLKF